MMRSNYRLRQASAGVGSRRGRAGFTLAEVLVTLIVMSVVVVGILAFFDLSNTLAKSQLNVAEMQTVQRLAQQDMAQMLTMAGVGGLSEGIDPNVASALNIGTEGVFPTGLALSVTNNVASGLDFGDATDPLPVMAGTDVLTVRGVFSTPVYYIEPQLPFNLDPGTKKITVALNFDVDVGVTQELGPLRDALTTPHPEAFVVYDRYNPGAFAVLEYIPGDSVLNPGGTGTAMTLGLSLGAGATYANEYGRLVLGTSLLQGAGGSSTTLPNGIPVQLPRNVGAIGLLEEYRYFVRQVREVPNYPSSRLKPILTRARFYPGTTVLHPEGALDLADNIIDLQIALGVDLPPTDGQILEMAAPADNDEVLYNHTDDDDGLSGILASDWAELDAALLFVRLNTLSQADRPDTDFPGTYLEIIEDHDYKTPPSIFNTGNYTQLRKRLLTTTIELRNLP